MVFFISFRFVKRIISRKENWMKNLWSNFSFAHTFRLQADNINVRIESFRCWNMYAMQFYHVQVPFIKCIIRLASHCVSNTMFTCCLFLFLWKTSISLPVVITDNVLAFRINRRCISWKIAVMRYFKLKLQLMKLPKTSSVICNEFEHWCIESAEFYNSFELNIFCLTRDW